MSEVYVVRNQRKEIVQTGRLFDHTHQSALAAVISLDKNRVEGQDWHHAKKKADHDKGE